MMNNLLLLEKRYDDLLLKEKEGTLTPQDKREVKKIMRDMRKLCGIAQGDVMNLSNLVNAVITIHNNFIEHKR